MRGLTAIFTLLVLALLSVGVWAASLQPSASCDSLTLEVVAPQLMRPGEDFAVVVTNLDDEVHTVTILVEGDIVPQLTNLTLSPGEQRYERVTLNTFKESGSVRLNITLLECGETLCQVNATVRLATGTSIITGVLYGAAILLGGLFAYILVLKKSRRSPRSLRSQSSRVAAVRSHSSDVRKPYLRSGLSSQTFSSAVSRISGDLLW